MAVDILIDKLTDCLLDSKTGDIVETEYFERITKITSKEYKGWKFDWSIPEREGYTVYELFLKGDDVVQGRIALKINGGVADINIVESAPHNYGTNGKYIGVGGHMFAIACQCSLDAGCDGVAAFTSKSDLVKHYKKELNAIEVMPRRLVIYEDAAEVLLNKYIRR